MLETISQILLMVVAVGLVTAGSLAIIIWMKNLTKKLSILRVFIQLVSTVGILITLLFIPLPWNPILSGLTFSIAYRLTIVFALIVVGTLVFGRFFCGWLCPFVLYMELLTRLRKFLRIPHLNLSERMNNALDVLRYVIIVTILILSLLLGPLHPNVWQFVIMFMGPFKSLIIVFLSPVDPLIESVGSALGFSIWNTNFHDLRGTILYFNGPDLILLTWGVFFAFTIGAFMVRFLWCRFCPVGATLSILNRFKPFRWLPIFHLEKVEQKCTKCGICKRVCPTQVMEVYEEKGGNVTSSKCLLCFRCVEMCPYEGCLKVNFRGKSIYKSKNWLEND
jgi:NosR/NirI family nitrous oxide reductase transcriptional regulator